MFPDIELVGRIEKKNYKKSLNTPASLLQSVETTRHEPKIDMVETLVNVIVKLRQRGKKDQPAKFLCDIPWQRG